MSRGEILGVPLDRDEEAPPGIFKALDDAVRGPGDDEERTDPVRRRILAGGLMMAAVDVEGDGAGESRQPAVRAVCTPLPRKQQARQKPQ